jgi:hypothetical protein
VERIEGKRSESKLTGFGSMSRKRQNRGIDQRTWSQSTEKMKLSPFCEGCRLIGLQSLGDSGDHFLPLVQLSPPQPLRPWEIRVRHPCVAEPWIASTAYVSLENLLINLERWSRVNSDSPFPDDDEGSVNMARRSNSLMALFHLRY